MFRITNISSELIGVDGFSLDPSEYVELETLSSGITYLQAQGKLSVVDVTTAGEEAEVAVSGALNSAGNALSVVPKLPANASGTISDATPVVIDMSSVPMPRNIWVNPSSATFRVEFSENGGVSYTVWPLGDVTAVTNDIRYDPLSSIRITKLSGTSGTYKVE